VTTPATSPMASAAASPAGTGGTRHWDVLVTGGGNAGLTAVTWENDGGGNYSELNADFIGVRL
jgi:hypothetical protein